MVTDYEFMYRLLSPEVGVDLDDTIYDIEEADHNHMHQHHGDKGWVIPRHERNGYAISKQYDLVHGEEAGNFLRAFQAGPDFFYNLQLMEGAREAIFAMDAKGINVRFVSSPYSLSQTVHTEKARAIIRDFDEHPDNPHRGSDDRYWWKKLVLRSEKAGEFIIAMFDNAPEMRKDELTFWTQIFKTQEYNKDKPGLHLDSWYEWEQVLEPLLVERGFELIEGKWLGDFDIVLSKLPPVKEFLERMGIEIPELQSLKDRIGSLPFILPKSNSSGLIL